MEEFLGGRVTIGQMNPNISSSELRAIVTILTVSLYEGHSLKQYSEVVKYIGLEPAYQDLNNTQNGY